MKMWTAHDLVKWVADNHPTDENALQQACWFIAYQEALMIHESWGVKDYARIVLRGDRLGGPYMSHDDVQTWLDAELDLYDGSAEDAMHALRTSLEEFFKV